MLLLQYKSILTPFVYPFTISKGTKTHQPALLVSLQQGRMAGFGEAPAINYYQVSVESMIEQLEAKRNLLERYALTEPKRFWHFLHHLLPDQNFLVAALDMAAWDLYAQRLHVPLYKCLGISSWQSPITDYTLGVSDQETMLQKMQAVPWPFYKIKMSSAADIDKIIFLRGYTDVPFRIDANESLSFDDTLRLLPELEQLNIEIVEQPLPVKEWDAMKELKAKSNIPLFADESCQTETDVALCAPSFDGINIKLTKCAGITPAMRMIYEAKNSGLKVMLGSMNETAIGTAALVHLSPLADYLDADGPLLLKDVTPLHFHYEYGQILMDEKPGLGESFDH